MVIKVGGSLMTTIPAKPPKGVQHAVFLAGHYISIQLSAPSNSWLKLQEIVGNWHLPFVASKQIVPPVLVSFSVHFFKIMDGIVVTDMRTAAASAVATKVRYIHLPY